MEWFTENELETHDSFKTLTSNVVKWVSKDKESPKIASNSERQLLQTVEHDKNVSPSALLSNNYDIYFIDAKYGFTEEDKNIVMNSTIPILFLLISSLSRMLQLDVTICEERKSSYCGRTIMGHGNK